MPLREGTKREPISLAIKDSIRSFYRVHQNMSVNDMILWAQEKYEIPFLPATMLTILFPKQKPTSLWAGSQTLRTERKRERFSSWPELEMELSKWYTSTKTPPKGQDLRVKAIELWRELAPNHYVGQKQPSFGDSWRDKFKSRHGFKLKWASVPGQHMETEATPFTGRAENTGNLLNFYNETAINQAMPFPTINLEQLEINVAPSLQNSEQLLPLVGRKEKTARQYRNPSMPLIELTRNEPHDTVLETRLGSGHRTMPPPLDSQYMRSQLRTVTNGTDSCPVSAYATNSQDIKVTGSGARRKKRQFNPTAVVGHIKRRRINNTTSLDSHSMSLCYELDSGADVSECILNLLLMVSNGQQYFSSHLVRGIINTLFSEVEVSKSFIPEEKCRQIFSKYHQARWSQIEINRLASMDALSLFKSAEIFNVHQPQLQAWLEWESQILFDSFIQFLPEDCEPEDTHIIANGSSNNGEGTATNGALSYQHNQTAAHNPRKRRDTMFSMRSKRGRIDIRVSKSSPCGSPYDSYSTSEIIFTPSGTTQLRFFLKQHITQEATVLLTPTLSIFNTIPNDSEVFEIAAYGTVDHLREIISSGKASLSDCDGNGRSLINYALTYFNVEIVKYLLEFVKEIDAYECNQFGEICPLIISTLASPYEFSEWKLERRIHCFKAMLDKGADPTIRASTKSGTDVSILSSEIYMGSKRTFQAIIDSGHPLITPSSFDTHCALLVSLAEWFRYGGHL